MKLVVKTNFGLGGSSGNASVELNLEHPTLRDVLVNISNEYQKGRPLFDHETNEVDSQEYSVLLNGTYYRFLPDKLLTLLAEGDEVQVFQWFELLGGG